MFSVGSLRDQFLAPDSPILSVTWEEKSQPLSFADKAAPAGAVSNEVRSQKQNAD